MAEMTKLPDTTLAWLAALIDGEGSIMLTHHNKGKSGKPNLRAVVSVSNTDIRLMQTLSWGIWAGRVYTHVRKLNANSMNHRRTAYTWRLNATEIRLILPKIIPWLTLKKEQAILLMEYLDMASSPEVLYSGLPNPRKFEIADAIGILNKTGV